MEARAEQATLIKQVQNVLRAKAPTALAFLGLLSAGSGLANAQDADDASSEAVIEEAIEEVRVIGTRITRRDFSSTSPVSTFDKLFLSSSGQPTLEESLNQLPQVQPGFGRTSCNPGG